MAIELKVPQVGESITEVVIGEWLRPRGEFAGQDEPVVVLETDKVNIDLPAPIAGVVSKVLKQAGDTAQVGEVIGYMEASDGSQENTQIIDRKSAAAALAAEPTAEAPQVSKARAETAPPKAPPAAPPPPGLSPSRRRAFRAGGHADAAPTPVMPSPAVSAPAASAPATSGAPGRVEELVPMTPLRKRVAQRLVQSQQSGAHLTTFNEVDLSEVMKLRKLYQESFKKRHGIKLGFMSFFVKAAVEALKELPSLNAEIRGTDIAYRNYYDIGVAVGGGKGLVVPVVRNAERLGFAEIETTIAELADRARTNRLKLEELQGGTFTISNGGIYGSMLSTPIINPPQTGILGMHNIQQRPVAVDGQAVVRPMMYLALTYDHRLVDGREAVTFLVRIKGYLENPTRILLEV